ncbi:DUF3022 domain-containing protein [Trinickia sp. NRRL B-1857]|uniref:DUF3022 domain-containing protein n=1 Tax=Trinickia sp. NRRL B-1857 TaxID=3162879 RepID=UPI003D2B8194
MELYRFECPSPDVEALAQAASDLFPEQTVFVERAGENGIPCLDVQWVAMRFGSTARRMTLTVEFAAPAFARYRASPPRARARSYAVLRAYVEAALGSLEEQYAAGQTVPREVTIELGDEFA